MTTAIRRAFRQAGKNLRRQVPAIVAILILAGLIGSSLAGALVL